MSRIRFIFIVSFLSFAFQLSAQYEPWLNESLPLEQRVQALIKQMTLTEKIQQMMNDAPAIERLHIPQYNWWNECLHGVARAGIATVYPQAIALAATFDSEAMKKSASIIADEAVAKHYEFVRQGKRGIYQGLTFWSPNINIFRDPRWGRGQETYGEDPYLTSQMGISFVNGLQGDNPDFYKLIATAKHFAVHSGPESKRHVFNAEPSTFDLYDTYLPAFKALVKEGKVASIMCAYNRLDGLPCCGNKSLLVDILKKKWGFNGYIVSDCGAIDDFYRIHKTSQDASEASTQAIRAGTDLECGNSYQEIGDAVKKGYLSEKEIDESLGRLFTARFKLGMFTSTDKNPYSKITYSVVDSKLHQQDALAMAQKSIVLLKNDHNTLPLSKKIKKIAVVGPCADDSVSLLGNYNGFPSKRVTILQGIQEKLGKSTEIVFEQGINLLDDKLFFPVDIVSSLKENGFKAEYFKNIKLEGLPVVSRTEKVIHFKGDTNKEIAPGLKAAWVSVRWTAQFIPDSTTDFTFKISGDDGFRLFVNNQKVMDHFSYHEEMTDFYTFKTEKGKKYELCLEYFQGDQGASISFEGGFIRQTNFELIADNLKEVDAIIFVGGISPTLEGEEMPVNTHGFCDGDRTTISLPEVQTRMMKALVKSNKPVIFIMQTGSALSVNWEQENIPAILNVWYGGQSIGTAVADVIFGDFNPAGRLPITFYKSEEDLPLFDDYSMKGRTYRYFEKEPLYPFGYGLSYSKFKYTKLKTIKVSPTGREVMVVVTVKNIGSVDGDEVAQLYIKHEKTDLTSPRCALKGFKRKFIRKGEQSEITFKLTPEDLSLVNEYGDLIQQPEKISIFVGGGQPNFETMKSGVKTKIQLKGDFFLFR